MQNATSDTNGNWENTTHGTQSSHAISNDLVGNSGTPAVEEASSFFPISPIVSANMTASKTVSPNRPGGTSAYAIGKQAISARKTNRNGSARVTATTPPITSRPKTAT